MLIIYMCRDLYIKQFRSNLVILELSVLFSLVIILPIKIEIKASTEAGGFFVVEAKYRNDSSHMSSTDTTSGRVMVLTFTFAKKVRTPV
ncbi:hypothetical protein NQ317_003927 [Molorchus minor]|uniref:Uncharacterized protein n=1 Tax=Molorchus minor TaxID=1323400 RepID=A0ABQ9IVE6_9CUCU|nr:hypothetical protein NQ317_003927 [Molorchus minor]